MFDESLKSTFKCKGFCQYRMAEDHTPEEGHIDGLLFRSVFRFKR